MRHKTKKALYFIAILPQTIVWDEVMKYKRTMADEFNCRFPLKLPPHITLQIPFNCPDTQEAEQNLIKGLKQFCHGELPFIVNWGGFGHFRRDVIFVTVENQKAVKQFQQRMIQALRDVPGFPTGRLTEMTHVHMTIGNKDLKANFHGAWDYFSKMKFKERTKVEKIHLLKHNKKFWEIYEILPLLNVGK